MCLFIDRVIVLCPHISISGFVSIIWFTKMFLILTFYAMFHKTFLSVVFLSGFIIAHTVQLWRLHTRTHKKILVVFTTVGRTHTANVKCMNPYVLPFPFQYSFICYRSISVSLWFVIVAPWRNSLTCFSWRHCTACYLKCF